MLTDMEALDASKRKKYFEKLKKAGRYKDIGKFKTRLIQLTFHVQDGRCYFCKVPMLVNGPENHPDRMTREHLLPKSLGGKWIENPALSCGLCNHSKRDMIAEQFVLSLRFQCVFERRQDEGIYS